MSKQKYYHVPFKLYGVNCAEKNSKEAVVRATYMCRCRSRIKAGSKSALKEMEAQTSIRGNMVHNILLTLGVHAQRGLL